MLKRVAFFIYGVLCYAIFLATFLYAVGFIGGFAVPTTLDGPRTGSLAMSIAIDLALQRAKRCLTPEHQDKPHHRYRPCSQRDLEQTQPPARLALQIELVRGDVVIKDIGRITQRVQKLATFLRDEKLVQAVFVSQDVAVLLQELAGLLRCIDLDIGGHRLDDDELGPKFVQLRAAQDSGFRTFRVD